MQYSICKKILPDDRVLYHIQQKIIRLSFLFYMFSFILSYKLIIVVKNK
jgi:hypothetical protein